MTDFAQAVRAYILEEFLPGENPVELKDDTPLISGGILDSVGTLKLVSFLEEKFQITVEANEVDVTNLDTIGAICKLVQSKVS
jgi:acyl carrier protein